MTLLWASGALLALTTPASAQWTRVTELPATDVFTVWVNGDTIAAGADTAVYVSTDAGATWKRSAKVAVGVTDVRAAFIRNRRLYAGADGQGVFVSDDLGDTWVDYNQGFCCGIGNDELDIIDLAVRGDSIYSASIGDGPWVRNLRSGAWSHFGSQMQAFSAGNMNSITVGGSRLFATGGFNGTVFFSDPGQTDWTLSLLLNDRFAPGLSANSSIWTGTHWVVGGGNGLYQSATGEPPWTFIDFGINLIVFTGFALDGNDVYASMGTGGGTLIARSHDGGVTWENVDTLFSQFFYDLAREGTTLYGARVDGLWRRSIANPVSVPPVVPRRLAFTIAGSQPVGDRVRFTFELPEAGPIAIELFDAAGRRVEDVIRESRPAGLGGVEWSAGSMASGVYFARLNASGQHATARLIHIAGQ